MAKILEPSDLARMLAQFEDRLEREPIQQRCPTCGRETVNRSMSAAVNVRAHISRGAWMMVDDDGYQLRVCGRCDRDAQAESSRMAAAAVVEALGRSAASPSSLVAEGAGSGNSAPEADLLDYQREGSTEDEDRRAMQSEYRPIGAC